MVELDMCQFSDEEETPGMGSKALALRRRYISDPFIFKTCPYDIGPSKLLSRLVCVCVCILWNVCGRSCVYVGVA